MRVLALLFFLGLNLNLKASDYECVTGYLDKKVVLAFNDGDVDYLRFYENDYGVVTATYHASTREVIRQILVYCPDYSDEIYLTSNRPSPSGPYKDPVKIYLPVDINHGESEAKVDLRWGKFYVPYPKIFIE